MSSMERSATKQHFHCTESHKLKALMIAFGIHLVITCSLLYTQLYQSTEHSKDIKRCHADLNDLRQEFRRREIQQDKQAPHDERTGKATMKQISPVHSKDKKQKRSSRDDCPFKKEDRCNFVKNLVLKEVNKTEDLLKEEILEMLDRKIKDKVMDTFRESHSAQAHIAFSEKNDLKLLQGRGLEPSTYGLYGWKTTYTDCKSSLKELHFCRRYFPRDGNNIPNIMNIDYDYSSITIKMFGFYWLSVQLTIEDQGSASDIDKVSIVMITPTRPREYVVLMSQLLTETRRENGKKFYTVAMGGQAKLLKDSIIKVVVIMKPNSKVKQGAKKIFHYGDYKMSFFDIYRLPNMDKDDGSDS